MLLCLRLAYPACLSLRPGYLTATSVNVAAYVGAIAALSHSRSSRTDMGTISQVLLPNGWDEDTRLELYPLMIHHAVARIRRWPSSLEA